MKLMRLTVHKLAGGERPAMILTHAWGVSQEN